uniref:MADF domain-containing protein n=1 Tax=Meloidogyne javanica TaxID=6303 RepID=A0A915N998_MELJA
MVDNFSDLLSSQNKTKMNRSGVSLNSEQKMKLIEAIHERPQIWDSSYEGFRSNPTRQGAFNEVAELLSEGGTEIFTRIQVQEEWGKLRYCFTRIVKKLYDEGYISPNGTVLQLNQDHQLITWPYWQPMNFLLEGVALQLCSTRGGCGGGSNYGGDDGVGDGIRLHYKKPDIYPKMCSEEPDNHKIRRSRKGMRGGLTSSAITHKHNKLTNSYLAIEEDLSGLSNPKTQSTNDLLMSNLLSSFAPQDLLLSNFNASNEQFHPQKIEDDIETII